MGIRFLMTAVALSGLFSGSAFGQFGADVSSPSLLPPADPMAEGQHTANAVAAVVEDRVITLGDVRGEIALLVPQLRMDSRTEAEFYEKLRELEAEVIQSLVDRILIVKHFEKEGFRVPQSYIEAELKEIIRREFDGDRARFLQFVHNQGYSVREFRQHLEEQLVVRYMRGQMRRSESIVSPARIEEFYEEKKQTFYQDEAVSLRIIQLTALASESDDVLLQTAEKIDRELREGADFADLAREYSQDRRSRQGGSWGWVDTSELREEWREVIAGLGKGEHSEPLEAREGLFILYVEDRREAGIPPIQEVRDQIETILASQMAREAQERWLERLRRDAYVRLYL